MKQLNIALVLFGALCVLALSGRVKAMADDNKIVLKNGISVHDVAATKEAEAAKPQKVGKAYLVPLGKPKSMIRSFAKPSFGRELSAAKAINEVQTSNGLIGAPYDTLTNTIVSTSSCLAELKNNIFINTKSDLTFDQVERQQSLFKSLGVSAGIEAGAGPVKLSVTAEFINSSLDDSKSVNMYFIQSSTSQAFINGVVQRSAGPGAIDGLTDSAKYEYLLSPESFRTLCGNSYVGKARAGALLIVRMTLKFSSEVAKEDFEGKMSLDTGGLADITAKIKRAVTDTKQDATLTISALQRGGNPLKVVEAFKISEAEASNAAANGQTVIPAMECGTGSNIDESCKNTISAIITYGKDKMPKQIENNTNLYYDLPEAIPYSMIGLDYEAKVENEQLKSFSAQYVKANEDIKIIDYYAMEKYAVDVNVNLIYELKRIANKLHYQIDNIFYNDSIINNCYTAYSPTLCRDILKWADNELSVHKLEAKEKEDLEYLGHNRYEFGGSGLWRGDRGIGACGLIPVTVGSATKPESTFKEGQFALDCGFGIAGNPAIKIKARTSIAEIRIPELSYIMKDANGRHEVKCLASDGPRSSDYHNKELIFKPQSVGSRTYFAQNVKCYVMHEEDDKEIREEFGAEGEDVLTLERKR
ncbi:MAG: hypothetical protein K0R14_1544 [Burkholderiales bacterium]|jgi:hypothetical protein|nr:hypothetical protein [Burkholderiales bacterium]